MPSKSPQKLSRPDFSREDISLGVVCGIDEAGRGPLAGPVYAACVFVPPEKRLYPVWKDVRDSKKLTPLRRDDLFAIIQGQSCFGIGRASAQEIDQVNILQATYLAMQRAYAAMLENFPSYQVDLALIDGNRGPQLPCPISPVVKGDALSVSIAAASILAKVSRDREMTTLHDEFPMYGWKENAGYGTPEHMSALDKFGLTPHHRLSFAPVKNIHDRQKAA